MSSMAEETIAVRNDRIADKGNQGRRSDLRAKKAKLYTLDRLFD